MNVLLILIVGSLSDVVNGLKLDVKRSVVVQVPVERFAFPCHIDNHKDSAKTTIKWEKHQGKIGDSIIIAEKQSNGQVVKHEQISCLLDGCSLVLLRPRPADSGLYTVTVKIYVNKTVMPDSEKVHATFLKESADVLATFIEKPEVLCLNVVIPNVINWLSVKSPVSQVILPCNYTLGNPDDSATIEWRRDNRNGLLVLSTTKGNISHGPQYSGRVTMGHGCSLVILDPQPEDSGNYSVLVRTLHSSDEWMDVYLEVSVQDQSFCSTVSVVILVAAILVFVVHVSGCVLLYICLQRRRRRDERDKEKNILYRSAGGSSENTTSDSLLSAGEPNEETGSRGEGANLDRQGQISVNLGNPGGDPEFGARSIGLRRRNVTPRDRATVTEPAIFVSPDGRSGSQSETDSKQLEHISADWADDGSGDSRLSDAGSVGDESEVQGSKILDVNPNVRDEIGYIEDNMSVFSDRCEDSSGAVEQSNRYRSRKSVRKDKQKHSEDGFRIHDRDSDTNRRESEEDKLMAIAAPSDMESGYGGSSGLSELDRYSVISPFIRQLDVITEDKDDAMNYGPSLHVAANNGDLEMCHKILDTGFNVNKMDGGKTALHVAVDNGYEDITKLLLEVKADTEMITYEGQTPLHLAAGNGSEEITKLLLEAKADVNFTNVFGITALMVSVCKGHIGTVDILLKNGARLDLLPKSGDTCLLLAARHGHREVCQQLINTGDNVNHQNEDGNTAIAHAASNGHKEVIELLLNSGARLDLRNKNHSSCLLLAADKGYAKVCNQLIEAGDSVNHQNKDKYTALMLAANRGHKDVIDVLLQSGARLDLMTQDKISGLHSAAFNGHTEVCQQLIKAGDNVNHQDKNGNTALHFAAKIGHLKTVDILLKAGSQTNIQNKDKYTALMLAANCGHKDVIDVLLQSGAHLDLMTQVRHERVIV